MIYIPLYVRRFYHISRQASNFSVSCMSMVLFRLPHPPPCMSAVFVSTQSLPLRKYSFMQNYDNYRHLFTACNCYNKQPKDLEPTEKELESRQNFFQQLKSKNKKSFLAAMKAYSSGDNVRRGHIEFIYAALKAMPEFGVERDLEAYKKVFNVFPKAKMIPKNMIQSEFYHFPRHQECGIFLLTQMEQNDVLPDDEMKELIINTFGKSTHVYLKYARLMYWAPKLKNISPFVLPDPLPSDAEKLAHLAIKRMSVDLQAQITHYKAEELDDSLDKTWIVSSQSPAQVKHLDEQPLDQPLFVEGSYLIWLKRVAISYFVLRTAPKSEPKQVEEVDLDDVSNLSLHMFGLPKPPGEVVRTPSTVHEQDDGTVMALCATGTSSKDSLLSWIRFLQRTNPKLGEIPVLFTLRSPPTAVTTVNIRPENFSHRTEIPPIEVEAQKESMQE